MRGSRSAVVAAAACLAVVGACTPAASRVPARGPVARKAGGDAAGGPVLSEAQVVRRCEPQVYARHGRPGYRGIRQAVLGLAYHRSYRAGDLVRLVDARGLPPTIANPSFPLILCRIPGAGSPGATDPRDAAATTGHRLLELCAETYAIPPRPRAHGWRRPDLRDAHVAARDSADGVTAALLALGSKDHGCLVLPASTGVPTYSVPDRPTRGYRTWFVPEAVPRAGSPDSFRWVYVTWGRVPPGARTLTFVRSDGTTAAVPVTADGAYAMVVRDSARRMTDTARYEFRGDDGGVLGGGPALRR